MKQKLKITTNNFFNNTNENVKVHDISEKIVISLSLIKIQSYQLYCGWVVRGAKKIVIHIHIILKYNIRRVPFQIIR